MDTAKALFQHVFCNYSLQEDIVSDQGPQIHFTSLEGFLPILSGSQQHPQNQTSLLHPLVPALQNSNWKHLPHSSSSFVYKPSLCLYTLSGLIDHYHELHTWTHYLILACVILQSDIILLPILLLHHSPSGRYEPNSLLIYFSLCADTILTSAVHV